MLDINKMDQKRNGKEMGGELVSVGGQTFESTHITHCTPQ